MFASLSAFSLVLYCSIDRGIIVVSVSVTVGVFRLSPLCLASVFPPVCLVSVRVIVYCFHLS